MFTVCMHVYQQVPPVSAAALPPNVLRLYKQQINMNVSRLFMVPSEPKLSKFLRTELQNNVFKSFLYR